MYLIPSLPDAQQSHAELSVRAAIRISKSCRCESLPALVAPSWPSLFPLGGLSYFGVFLRFIVVAESTAATGLSLTSIRQLRTQRVHLGPAVLAIHNAVWHRPITSGAQSFSAAHCPAFYPIRHPARFSSPVHQHLNVSIHDLVSARCPVPERLAITLRLTAAIDHSPVTWSAD